MTFIMLNNYMYPLRVENGHFSDLKIFIVKLQKNDLRLSFNLLLFI